jgi:hypothetical protein
MIRPEKPEEEIEIENGLSEEGHRCPGILPVSVLHTQHPIQYSIKCSSSPLFQSP